MRHRTSIRAVVAVAALAATTLAGASCTRTSDGVAPIVAGTAPSQTGEPTRPVPTTGTTTPPARSPATTRPATRDPACLGAVRYVVDARKAGPSDVCIAVGGLLRVENLGPGELTIQPAAKVACSYEAGIHECRLIATGRTTVRINGPTAKTFTMVVAAPATPPRPATACVGSGTVTVDASAEGPAWPALCLRQSVVLRLTNHGPDNFTVSPQANVTCRYEAGTRECRFTRTGTVTFTITNQPNVARPLIVVVVP